MTIQFETEKLRYEPGKGLIKDLKGLKFDTIDDFIERSKVPGILEYGFSSNLKIKLIKRAEIDSIFSGDIAVGWNNFRKKYDSYQGIVTLSKIGYNKDRNQALVYYDRQGGPTSGAEYYIVLVDGKKLLECKCGLPSTLDISRLPST